MWRPYVLHSCQMLLPSIGRLRSPRRAAHEVRVGDQHEGSQGPRPHDPAVGPAAGRPGHRVARSLFSSVRQDRRQVCVGPTFWESFLLPRASTLRMLPPLERTVSSKRQKSEQRMGKVSYARSPTACATIAWRDHEHLRAGAGAVRMWTLYFCRFNFWRSASPNRSEPLLCVADWLGFEFGNIPFNSVADDCARRSGYTTRRSWYGHSPGSRYV